jgi:hypothetical protein
MGHVASVNMIIRAYSETLILWPTTRNARAGSQSTIHPKLTEPRRARTSYRTDGPRWAACNIPNVRVGARVAGSRERGPAFHAGETRIQLALDVGHLPFQLALEVGHTRFQLALDAVDVGR